MASRVASLLPAATEIVCAVGAAAELVGVSHECDFPPGVRDLPVLTRARLHAAGSSAEIDRQLRSVLMDALSIYEVDLPRLEAVAPDVIVTQDLCDVCAVSFQDVCVATEALVRSDIRIVNLHPTRLDDIWGDITRVADVLGRATDGARVTQMLRARTDDIARRSAACSDRPRVLTIEWLDPVMVGGMWMPELIGLAGGIPLVTGPGDHAPTLSRTALATLAPDVVLVKPCGFSLERVREELHLLRAALPWATWPATRDGRVYVADGNAYFNRPGPRIVESLEILAACLHPEAFADLREKHRDAAFRVDADGKAQPF